MKNSRLPRGTAILMNNRALTLQLLFSHGRMSRTDIADYLGITTAAVTSIVNDLDRKSVV